MTVQTLCCASFHMNNVQKSSTIILAVWVENTSISKAINNGRLQGIYKLSDRWVIIWLTVHKNSTKYVLKWILIQVSGLTVGELLFLFIYLFVYFVQLIHTAWGHHPTGYRTRQKLHSVR
jgi:hypothetical protein